MTYPGTHFLQFALPSAPFQARQAASSVLGAKIRPMAGVFFLDTIRRALRERARQKRVRAAASWPQITAHINSWKLLPAADESGSFTHTHFIEAAFHFTLDGNYYGGYANSVPMPHREAEQLATGSPSLTVRYNPSNPDQTAVLADDNRGQLPFDIISG